MLVFCRKQHLLQSVRNLDGPGPLFAILVIGTLTCPALSMSTVVSFYALTQDSIVLDNDIKGHDLS